MSHRNPVSRVLVALAVPAMLVAAAPLAAQQPQKWFHVRVSDHSSNPVEVSVNLPLTLIETALEMIPEEVNADMKMELDEGRIDLADLRKLWQELRAQDDATFVTVESEDETVRVAKEGDYLIARTLERTADGADVNVKLPFAVVDALFAGTDEDEIDLAGAIRALAESGDGDMVTVTDDETRVRVWIDDRNESEV